MQIGIDFGTTYTKIAYVQDGQLRLFRFPGPNGRDYIPTAVAYRRSREGWNISIGEAALSDAIHLPDVQLATRFKMFLPIQDPAERRERGWNLDRTPEEVAKDYFEQLLRASRFSFEKTVGPIESVVVSVPEIWQRSANNPGAEAVLRILVDELKLPVDHLRSEPVCAAAYFVYEYQRTEQRERDRPFNLLICDMGGGTFDVALCRVKGQEVEVIDFDGNSEGGWGLAGSLFDRNLVCTVYQAVEGRPPDENLALELSVEFEAAKILHHDQAVEDFSSIIELLPDPRLEDIQLAYYTFRRKYTPTLKHVMESFQPVAEGIQQVITRLRNRAERKGLTIDRVAIVGGFGQFPLVQHAILKSLGIRDKTDVRFDERLHRQNKQFYAIAYGAALIAAGEIKPVEYYPHTIGVFVFRLREGRLWKEFLPIIEAGKVAAGQARPMFAKELVQVRSQETGVLPIGLQIGGIGEPIRLSLPPVRYPPPGVYSIGIQIDRSNMAVLVFQRQDSGERIEYRLGEVNPLLIVEG